MYRKLLLAIAIFPFAASPAIAWDWPFFGGSDDEQTTASQAPPAGGRAWWRKHKDEAIMVPGKGYQVPGFDGYFDGNGIPISAAVDEQSIRLQRPEEDAGGLLPGLDPKKAVNSVREAAGYGPDQQAAQAAFDQGVQLFKQGEYDKAADLFETAASRWPGTGLAAKAMFNQAESLFFAEDYDHATDAYIELLDKHSSTSKLDVSVERIWEIARFWEQSHFADEYRAPFDYQPFSKTRPSFDTIGNAVRLYEAIRLNDPTGPRADDAIMATAEIHRRRKRYADADYHYTLLREEYPRSEHQFEAHLRGLQAKMLRYYGPDYDGKPLLEAQRLEELTRVNFSGRLSEEEQQRLQEVRGKVARALEERQLRMIEYYEGTEHYGAAEYYAERFAEKHPESPAVEKVRERVAQYEGKPATPPTRMAWLVNLLPENKRFEKLRAIEKVNPAPTLAPDGGQTMIAEGKSETSTR